MCTKIFISTPAAARASRGTLGVACSHRALWLGQRGVPVELRPRHAGRGTGVWGQGPAPARQSWQRSPISGYRTGICPRPPGQCGPPARLRGCASPGARRPLTHPPTPASTDAPRPALPEGRLTGTHPPRGGAHRDLPLQRQGAPGVDLSRTGCTAVKPSRKLSVQRPSTPPHVLGAPLPRAPPRAHTRPGLGGQGLHKSGHRPSGMARETGWERRGNRVGSWTGRSATTPEQLSKG